MIEYLKVYLFVFIVFWPLYACSLSMNMEDMRRVFQDDVQESVGLTHAQLTKDEFHFIGKRQPTETKRLDNGNILYVYGEYWLQYEIQRTPCDVYLEVNPDTDIVVNAFSRGSGCYRPY